MIGVSPSPGEVTLPIETMGVAVVMVTGPARTALPCAAVMMAPDPPGAILRAVAPSRGITAPC